MQEEKQPSEVGVQGEFNNELVEKYSNQAEGNIDLEGRTNNKEAQLVQ